jgi:hypothetical protein
MLHHLGVDMGNYGDQSVPEYPSWECRDARKLSFGKGLPSDWETYKEERTKNRGPQGVKCFVGHLLAFMAPDPTMRIIRVRRPFHAVVDSSLRGVDAGAVGKFIARSAHEQNYLTRFDHDYRGVRYNIDFESLRNHPDYYVNYLTEMLELEVSDEQRQAAYDSIF